MYFFKSPVLRQIMISIVANFTYFHIAMGMTSVSPMLSKLRDPNQTQLVTPLTDTEASWIVSVSFLSGLIMIWISGYLSYFMGRKACILLLTAPRVVLCFLYLFASRTWMLILARALDGINDTVLPHAAAYASEIASTKIRGAICMICHLMAALATMLMLSVGPYMSYVNFQIFNTCIVVATCLPMIFIPESPYYLYTVGKKEECIKTLTYLRGSTNLAQEEYKNYFLIKEANFNARKFLNNKIALKTMGIVVLLGITSQAIGANVIMSNLQSIYEASQTNVTPELSSLISGCIQFIAVICAVVLIDKFGRKPLLIIGLIGYTIGMISLGIFFKLTFEKGVAVEGALNYLPLVSILLMIFFNAIGLGSLVHPLMAELFEGPLRTIGVSVGQFIALIVIFLSTKYYYLLIEVIGAAATYWIFAGFSLLTCLFIFFCVPETKGKPFSQIQRELGRKDGDSKEIM